MFKFKRIMIVLSAIFFAVTLGTVSRGFAFFDTLSDSDIQNMSIGYWDFSNVNEGLAEEITDIVDDAIENDPNTEFDNIYNPSGDLRGVTVEMSGVEFFDYEWDVIGYGTKARVSSIGYISLIDRSKDEWGNPIHDIYNEYYETPPFPEYNYFTSYDVENTETNNNYSIRLNYDSDIILTNPVSNLSQISFYASRGLEDPNDEYEMGNNRRFEVFISTDKTTWFSLGKDKSVTPTSTSYSFNYYSYDVPTQYLGEDLYVKIIFNGKAKIKNGVKEYSRLVIDELVFTYE